jgi:hypothetical protein
MGTDEVVTTTATSEEPILNGVAQPLFPEFSGKKARVNFLPTTSHDDFFATKATYKNVFPAVVDHKVDEFFWTIELTYKGDDLTGEEVSEATRERLIKLIKPRYLGLATAALYTIIKDDATQVSAVLISIARGSALKVAPADIEHVGNPTWLRDEKDFLFELIGTDDSAFEAVTLAVCEELKLWLSPGHRHVLREEELFGFLKEHLELKLQRM